MLNKRKHKLGVNTAKRTWPDRAVPLTVVVALVAACTQQVEGAKPIDYKAQAQALIQGVPGKRVCKNDHDCGPSLQYTPLDEHGACVLGTCFGLLTADNRAARQVVLQRLRSTDDHVRIAATPLLLAALERTLSGPQLTLAAIEGLGAVLQASGGIGKDCAAPCVALRAQMTSSDPRLAAAARIALGHAGDSIAMPGLMEDLHLGTELLRCEAASALAVWIADDAVRAALIAQLSDASPVVVEAVVNVLIAQMTRPDVRVALDEVWRVRFPHLGYAVQSAGFRVKP